MTRPNVVITNRVHQDVLDLLASRCNVTANEHSEAWSCAELTERAKDADCMMAFMTDCIDRKFLQACPKLRMVASVLKGFDNIDVDACNEHGVWLSVVPNRLTAATAELTIGLLIAISRHIVQGDAYVRQAHTGWRPIFYGRGLDQSTVGILGMGCIGQAVASRLKGFGCRILYFDEKHIAPSLANRLGVRFTFFSELMRTADFIVVALPLNAETRHLVNAEALRLVKPECFIVNTARGSIVDEEAIADALSGERLGGYAADVFEMEDLAQKDRPSSIPSKLLLNRTRTIFTPHLGSAEYRARYDAELEMAHSILDFLDRRVPRGAVNTPDPVGMSAKC